MADKYDTQRNNPDSLGTKYVDLTSLVGTGDIPDNVRAILFDADGTCTTADAGGANAVTGVPVTRNHPLWARVDRVSAMTGGPTKMFGII